MMPIAVHLLVLAVWVFAGWCVLSAVAADRDDGTPPEDSR